MTSGLRRPVSDANERRCAAARAGERAGYDGTKRCKGSKVHIVADTLGHLLPLFATLANEQDRSRVAALAEQVQQVTDELVEVAYVDQDNTGTAPAEAAQAKGIALIVVKLLDAKRGLVLLPRRWVVERSFAWITRFRRLVRGYERLPETLAGLHFVVLAILMVSAFTEIRMTGSA